jgi:hypothetical protein
MDERNIFHRIRASQAAAQEAAAPKLKNSPADKKLVGDQENLPEHLKDKIEAAPETSPGKLMKAGLAAATMYGLYKGGKALYKKYKGGQDKTAETKGTEAGETSKDVKPKSDPYASAKQKDENLDSYIAKRKTLEKGSDEWKRNQNKINEAYGVDKRYEVADAKPEVTDKTSEKIKKIDANVEKKTGKLEDKITKIETRGEKKKAIKTARDQKRQAKESYKAGDITKEEFKEKHGGSVRKRLKNAESTIAELRSSVAKLMKKGEGAKRATKAEEEGSAKAGAKAKFEDKTRGEAEPSRKAKREFRQNKRKSRRVERKRKRQQGDKYMKAPGGKVEAAPERQDVQASSAKLASTAIRGGKQLARAAKKSASKLTTGSLRKKLGSKS